MDRIWYASYGSNLRRERFLCYLRGGTPEGNSRRMPGCKDRTEPSLDRPIRIPHGLYFAKERSGWGEGGVAFIRPAADESEVTFGRMYLITREQFLEVVAQENRRPPVEIGRALGAARFAPGWTGELPGGWYDRVLCLGEAEGRPVVTFTSGTDLGGEPVRPAESYLTTILRGLLETYLRAPDPEIGLETPEKVVDYLGKATRGTWREDELRELVERYRGEMA